MKTQQHSSDTYSSNKTSEIAIWTIAIIILFLFASNLSAANLNIDFDEESYINDIPFDTEMISEQILLNQLQDYSFEDEAYINDIPFNTEIVALEVNPAAFENEEETINDIPFDTEWIVANYNYKIALTQSFDFTDENTIYDIPFEINNLSTHNNCDSFEWFVTNEN